MRLFNMSRSRLGPKQLNLIRSFVSNDLVGVDDKCLLIFLKSDVHPTFGRDLADLYLGLRRRHGRLGLCRGARVSPHGT